MMRYAVPVLLVAVSMLAGEARAEESADPLAVFTVEAGDHERIDTPVSVALPEEVGIWQPMRLVEVAGDGRRPVPSQVEPASSGSSPRLWFVLDGKTEAGETRRYELRRGEPVEAEGVRMTLTPTSLDVSFQDAPVFRYHHAHVPPPDGIDPAYIRSGYIHPLRSPSGMLLTEDFPSDHYHHKGIWFPWTRTRFEGRDIDFWNLAKEEGTVRFAGFRSVRPGPVYGGFQARHEFVDLTDEGGGKVALDETWDVRLWAVGGPEKDYWLFDLTSEQRPASDSPLELLEYRYGGLGFRGAEQWKGEDYEVLSSEGRTKADGHTTRAKWCAHSGAIDGEWATVVLMCHPSNERFPEPMRIWAEGGAFFNWAVPQAGDWTFEPGETQRFRYRFLVHEGRIDAAEAERVWNSFAHPPVVRVEVGS